MSFRSEVSSCASRPLEAMVWISEIESAMSVADLKKLQPITEPGCRQTSKFLILKLARGLKKIINGDFKRRIIIREEAARKDKRIFTGRQVAWIIHEFCQIIETDESVLDLDEILKFEMVNDKVQSFNTRWHETIIAMKKSRWKPFELAWVHGSGAEPRERENCRGEVSSRVI